MIVIYRSIMMPPATIALGGLDEIGNLFASCAPCNLAKRDRTALEFVASYRPALSRITGADR